jgi:hypothetical protein
MQHVYRSNHPIRELPIQNGMSGRVAVPNIRVTSSRVVVDRSFEHLHQGITRSGVAPSRQSKWRRYPERSTKRVRREGRFLAEGKKAQRCRSRVEIDDMRWTRLQWNLPNGIIQTTSASRLRFGVAERHSRSAASRPRSPQVTPTHRLINRAAR